MEHNIYSYVEWFVAGADGVVCEEESNAIIVVFVVYSNRNGGMGFLRGPETYIYIQQRRCPAAVVICRCYYYVRLSAQVLDHAESNTNA